MNNDIRTDNFIDNIMRLNAARRERELLDRSQPYMRNAHLLPPREEFVSVDWYVQVLNLFEQANTELRGIYRFLPTLAQRRANGHALMKWDAAQRATRAAPTSGGHRKRALGLLDWRCFTGARALAQASKGCRDNETRDTLRYLAPLVNDGSLSRDELAQSIIEASHANRHIPDNKSRRAVEADVDRAVAKFTEPFGWDRLDDDCC